jgi:hypothetical protein
MSYLRCLCLFVYIDDQRILCCVSRRLVSPMLPVSLECPFLIAPSVFSNVYSINNPRNPPINNWR